MTLSGSSLMNLSRDEYADPDLVLTDAVALQRAVISDHDITVPASADIVAKVVAHYTSKAQVRDASNDAFPITHIPSILIGRDDPHDPNLPATSGHRSPHVLDSNPSPLDNVNYESSLLVHQHHTVPGSPVEPFVTPVRTDDIESPPNTDRAYELLLRNYARLQGHTETLAEEAADATRDRARLQAEVAALRAQLDNARSSHSLKNSILGTVAKAEVSDAGTSTDLRWPEQPRLSSESRQQLMEGADQYETLVTTELIRLKAELAQALAHAEQQREAAACASAEAAVSAERAAATQAALMAARGEVLQMGDAAHRLEELVQRAEEEVVAVASARDWYQEQLRTMQEARSILQEELADARTQLAKQANELERQRAEASQARHELSLTQQRALAEKRLLARQLELIEADMLEREATAAASDNGGAAIAAHKAELLALQQQLLVSSSQTPEAVIELQDEVQRWRHAADAARAEADALDAQRVEQAKQIDELRQKLAVLQHETETMQERLAEADSRLKSATKKNVHLEASVLKARQEKSNIEVALQLALDEKVAFSVALDSLKANAAKVEANFKQIRQELIAKQQQCEELQTERAELLRQLNNAAAAAANCVQQPTLQQLQLPSSAARGGPVAVSTGEAAAADVHLPSSCGPADVSRPQEHCGDAMKSSACDRQPPHPLVEAQDARVDCERCRRILTGDQQLIPKQLDELVALRQSLEVATSQLQQAAHDRTLLEQRCRSAESAAAEWHMRADRQAEVARAAEADLRVLISAKSDLESRLVNLPERSEHGGRGSTSTGVPLKNGAASLASRSDSRRRTQPPADGVRLLETMDASASSLHDRIAALQQQLDVHSSAVRSSSENWRTIEDEIRELQRIVHGDHAITTVHGNQ